MPLRVPRACRRAPPAEMNAVMARPDGTIRLYRPEGAPWKYSCAGIQEFPVSLKCDGVFQVKHMKQYVSNVSNACFRLRMDSAALYNLYGRPFENSGCFVIFSLVTLLKF